MPNARSGRRRLLKLTIVGGVLAAGVAAVPFAYAATAPPPPTGFVKICKAGATAAVTGSFQFTVSGVTGAVTVPVGACSKPGDSLIRAAQGRQDDDRCAVRAAHRPKDRQAVDFGQHHIEDHQRGRRQADRGERRPPVLRFDDPKSFSLQVHPDESKDFGIVVDDENRASISSSSEDTSSTDTPSAASSRMMS